MHNWKLGFRLRPPDNDRAMPPRAVLPLIVSCMLTGCSLAAAPSFELFGAYFPAWMLCALIGIVAAAITRLALTTPALSEVIPFQFAVCTAAGVIVALLTWVVLFG
jgi:YtcA family